METKLTIPVHPFEPHPDRGCKVCSYPFNDPIHRYAKEFTLWATRKGNEDWQEELIASTNDADHLTRARAWAEANGFDRLRVSEFKGDQPDFAGTVRV